MTGSRSPLDFAGVQTLSVRQSSLAGPAAGPPHARVRAASRDISVRTASHLAHPSTARVRWVDATGGRLSVGRHTEYP